MLRWLVLALGLLAVPSFAADDIDSAMRRVEAALARISQEQQSVYQQFQMVQEMRRSEQAQTLSSQQSYTPPATPPNYDDVQRAQEERTQRVKDLQYELDRLYARYRELEEQKKPLLEELATLAQQRGQTR